ncbi:protoheme IX farnesyltransferase, partial [Pseudomonas aeruginosa]
MKLKRYLLVAKPGIIFGNLIAVAGGYFLAARGSVEPMLLLATVIGLSLVVASGCVLNNCIDRDIDRHMERTRGRVTVTGQISLKAALAHGLVLGVAGFGLLWWRTNPLTTALAGFGYFVYVGLYSLWFKRRSQYGTLVGSLPGAMPPVVAYCPVSGPFDAAAPSLLAIFFLCHMPPSSPLPISPLKAYHPPSIPLLQVARGLAVPPTPTL